MDITTTAQQADQQANGRFARLRRWVQSRLQLRLLLPLGMLMLLLVGTATLLWFSYTWITDSVTTVVTQQTAVAQLSVNAQHNLLMARTHEQNYLHRSADLTAEEARGQYVNPLITNIAQIRQRGIELKLLLEGSGGPAEEIALVDELMAAVDQYENSFLTMVESQEANPVSALSAPQTELDTAAQTISSNLNTLGENAAARAAAAWERSQLIAQIGLLAVIILLAGSVLGAGYVSWRLRRTVIRPIRALHLTSTRFLDGESSVQAAMPSLPDELQQLTQQFNLILADAAQAVTAEQKYIAAQYSLDGLGEAVDTAATGDLTVTAKTDDALTGKMGQKLNFMLTQLSQMIAAIEHSTANLNKATQALHQTADTLADKGTVQVDGLTAVSTSLSGLSGALKSSGQTAAESAQVSQQARRHTRQNEQVMQQTVKGMERIRQQVQETAKHLKRLGESTQEMGEISQLVRDIADQTSLLALNASIKAKAASTPEQMQLSQQIEQLSERAGKSAAEIDALVAAQQREMTEAITAMEAVTGEVVTGSKLAAEARETVQTIAALSERLTDLTGAVAQDMKKQAYGTTQLATQMETLTQQIEHYMVRTQKLASAITGMTRLMVILNQAVEQFQLPAHNEYSPAKVD